MNRLKELLGIRGIAQKEIAAEMGVSRPTVSDWVNNKSDPREENLHKLGKLLNVDVGEIIVQKSPAPWTPEDYLAHGVAMRTPPRTNLSAEDLNTIAVQVKAMLGGANNLTPSEQELIDDFRLLSNTQKSRVRAMIAGYLDAKFNAEE